eukprot:8567872-Pyramimonas_sp.AAC.1
MTTRKSLNPKALKPTPHSFLCGTTHPPAHLPSVKFTSLSPAQHAAQQRRGAEVKELNVTEGGTCRTKRDAASRVAGVPRGQEEATC